MKFYLITIDGGTTNTRIFLWDANQTCIDQEKSHTGVKDAVIDGNNRRLKEAVSSMITFLPIHFIPGLQKKRSDRDCILHQNRTSDYGQKAGCLCQLPFGPVLADDLFAVKQSDALDISPEIPVIVAGKEPLQDALLMLFQEDGYFHTVMPGTLPDIPSLSGYDALTIARFQGEAL